MKTQVLGHPPQVDLADGQPDPGLGLDDPEELQGLGRLAQAETADAEPGRQLVLGRQAVPRDQVTGRDMSLDVVRDAVADLPASEGLEHGLWPIRGRGPCGPPWRRIDYLTIWRPSNSRRPYASR